MLFICCVCHTFCFHILLGNRVQILFYFALHMIICDALKNRWTVLVISYICLSFLLRFFLISEKNNCEIFHWYDFINILRFFSFLCVCVCVLEITKVHFTISIIAQLLSIFVQQYFDLNKVTNTHENNWIDFSSTLTLSFSKIITLKWW